MTVTVTLTDGDSDKYVRYGDSYVKRNDGALDVVRDGAKEAHGYAPGTWTEVQGDEMRAKHSWCRSRLRRKGTESPSS